MCYNLLITILTINILIMLDSSENGNKIDQTKPITSDYSRLKGGRYNGELLKSILNMQTNVKRLLEDGKKNNQ